MKIKELLVATNNAHKIKEYQDIFAGTGVKILCPKDLNISLDPEENGTTYKENATIKASAFFEQTNLPTISDDSGIEIEVLGDHFPGIHSHRFMEEHGGQIKTLEYLVKNCLGSKAKFHCSIVLVGLENDPLEFVGEVPGHISNIVKMADFGYDPVFYVSSENKTYAELSLEVKNELSHRALAAKELLKYLKENSYI